jgi:fumarate hydratase class II
MLLLSEKTTRIEKDVLGKLDVPIDVYWGINTQRAVLNFKISGRTIPERFLLALAKVKKACLLAHMENKNIPEEIGTAALNAVDEILLEQKWLDQFPIDIFQTGSGTQINMNMNEVLANRANELLGYPLGKKTPVHPNDHINMSQSSNDVIPTTMHLAILESLQYKLFPAIEKLTHVLESKIEEFRGVIKVGRTHLQDAVPIPLSTEFEVYKSQIQNHHEHLRDIKSKLQIVPIGGTAVGTGLNASQEFTEGVIAQLSALSDFSFSSSKVKAEQIASHNLLVHVSGLLRLLALSCLKMANDIRWMGSGPRAGLGELSLPQNEPGSSIMPGKINPTQSEALIQVCMQVIGYDATVAAAEGFGSVLDLNVTKPVIIVNILDAIRILSNGIISFTDYCLSGLSVNHEHIQNQLERNLMIVTRIAPIVGYDKAGEIARRAYLTGKTIRETIEEMGIKLKENLDELLDPRKMV